MAQQLAQLEAMITNGANLNRSSSGRDLKLENPEPFYGDRKKLQSYLAQLSMKFNAKPERFDSHIKRIFFAAALLQGSAFAWFEPHLDEGGASCKFCYFQEFETALKNAFRDPDEKLTAERELKALRQEGKYSDCSAYNAKFLRITARLPWGNKALMSIYRDGLNTYLKD